MFSSVSFIKRLEKKLPYFCSNVIVVLKVGCWLVPSGPVHIV
jgi:hypothetical protein